MKRKIVSVLLVLTMVIMGSIVVLPQIAMASEGTYKDITKEKNFIQYYLDKEMYTQALNACNYILNNYDISTADRNIIYGFKQTAEKYLPSSPVGNTIPVTTVPPMNTAEPTAAPHDLTIDTSVQQQSPVEDAMRSKILGWWLHCDDVNDVVSIAHAYNIQFNSDGTVYLETWRTKGYGTYVIEAPNKIFVTYTAHIRWAEMTEYVPEPEPYYINFELNDSGLYEITENGEIKWYIHTDNLVAADDIPNAYLPWYYNSINEINQIRNYIQQGLYVEAMQLCETTKRQHILSSIDIEVIDNLYNTASSQYDTYLYNSYLNEISLNALNFGQAFFGEQFELCGQPTYEDGYYWIFLYWPTNSYHERAQKKLCK